MSSKEKIAQRPAAEIGAGQIINLGIGIPTLIPKYLEDHKQVVVHSENGILGMGLPCKRGTEDRNLIDAGGTYVTTERGAAFFDSALSFTLVRGGRLDIAFIGALEVSAAGDLANWIIPGQYSPGIGGGMELAQKARRLIVTSMHTTRNGDPKILKACTLPLLRKKAGTDDEVPALIDSDISHQAFRKNWARLIQKIYNVNPLLCPKFSGSMKIISFIDDSEIIKKILNHLDLWNVKRKPPPCANVEHPPLEEPAA